MKLLIPFLFVTTLSWGQNLFQTQTIGQSNNRNQRMGKGFQLGDSLDVDTFLVNLPKIWLPYITTTGGATDSVLSIDPVTNMIELRPQTAAVDTMGLSNRIDLKLDSVRRDAAEDSVFEYYDNGTKRFAFLDSIGTTDTTGLSARIDLKVDSVKRRVGTDSVFYYTNGTEHFGFTDSVSAATIGAAAWLLTGNAATDSTANFLGTTDNQALVVKTNNIERMRVNISGNVGIGSASPSARLYVKGVDSLATSFSLKAVDDKDSLRFGVRNNGLIHAGIVDNPLVSTQDGNLIMGYNTGLLMGDTCKYNTCFGVLAGRDLFKGERNTLIGYNAGIVLRGVGEGGVAGDRGYENVYIGYGAAENDTSGYENTFVGTFAGNKNTNGHTNSFFGLSAGMENTTGDNNTNIGANAGLGITTGSFNTNVGNDAGRTNSTSGFNVSIGNQAAFSSTTDRNVFVGEEVAFNATSGNEHTIIGWASGFGITTGTNNIIIGSRAAFNGNYSNSIILDQQNRGTAAKEVTHFPVYITVNADSSLTDIRLNGEIKTYELTDLRKTIDVTTGDAATTTGFYSRIRKDTTGTTFTLTNGLITANSIILLTQADAALDATATRWTVSAAAGSATITFDAAPTADLNMNVFIGN